MAVYKILENGVAVNRISASAKFMEEHYFPEQYELEPIAVVPEPTHKTEFSPKELYNSFTAEEIILAKVSSDPAIVAQAVLFSEGRDVVINATDASYQSTVDQFEAAGVITADRAVSYRQGLPLENT